MCFDNLLNCTVIKNTTALIVNSILLPLKDVINTEITLIKTNKTVRVHFYLQRSSGHTC
jgi:hypothetical protein